jgi:hypothetical protein
LSVEAFDLAPQAAVAGRIRRIDAFRNDALDMHRAGFLVESWALPDDMVAVMQARRGVREQAAEPLFALDERPRPEIVAVEVKEIEQEEDERRRVAAVGGELDDVEGGGPTPHNSPSR